MQINSLPTTFGATNMVVATGPCSLVAVRGFFKGTTADRWLQIFDASALPANATVPLRSFQLLQNLDFYKDFGQGPLQLSTGCVIAISTTEATLTIATIGTDLADFSVDLESSYPVATGLSIAGDLTTPTSTLSVWATGSVKRLYSFICVNNEAVDCYVMLFPNTPAVNNLPLLQWKVLQGATLNAFFGSDGIDVNGLMSLSTDAFRVNSGLLTGCYLALSTTTPAFTKSNDQASYIKATYK